MTKQLFSIFLFSFFFLSMSCSGLKKAKKDTPKSGIVDYVLAFDERAKSVGMQTTLGQSATMRFNEQYLVRKKAAASPGNEFQLVDLKTAQETQYMSFRGTKYAIKIEGEAVPEVGTLTWTKEKKEIAGYQCRKAVWMMNGTETYVYFTKEIPVNYCPFQVQDFGFALEYQLIQPYGNVTYTATAVKLQAIDQRLLTPSDDYKEVTPAEFQRAVFSRPKSTYKDKEAINFSLTDLDGKNVTLEALRGKIVLINFWFTTCAPCVKEIPDLNELKQHYAQEDIEFLAITFNEEALVRNFVAKHPFDFRVFTDAREAILSYGISSYPSTLIIDKEGIVAAEKIGGSFTIKAELMEMIDAVLNK